MQDFSFKDYPVIYDSLKINPRNLGCIMLDTEPLKVSDVIPETALFINKDDPDSHAQGYASETSPHVTLLYGLLQSGQMWRSQVDLLLEPWQAEPVTIAGVDFFYSTDPLHDYITIVAKVAVSSNLLEAHTRLSLLPHINTHPTYTPHITLAYVDPSSQWQDYVKQLNTKYADELIAPVGLNHGDF